MRFGRSRTKPFNLTCVVYESRAITLSAALTSGAAWDGDNTPELSKSFTSLMKESSFTIAPALFPAFSRSIACCRCLTSELS